jgi:hypothetical protein
MVDQLRYSQIIGSLMYLASATRPDIAYAVSKLSRFVSNPSSEHWRSLEHVMRYLVGTMNYGFHYSGDPKVLEGYSDANWISDADELKATRGCVHTWRWRCCLEVLQVDHSNQVNNGSRTRSIGFCHCRG